MDLVTRATECHKKGELDKAMHFYEQMYQQGLDKATLYQNYGALLRETGDEKKALKVYELGLSKFPKHLGIRGNQINILMTNYPITALQLCLSMLHDCRSLQDLEKRLAIEKNTVANILNILEDANCIYWKILFLKYYYDDTQGEVSFMLHVFKMAHSMPDLFNHDLESELESRLSALDMFKNVEVTFALSQYYFSKKDSDKAFQLYERGMRVLNSNTNGSTAEYKDCQKLVDITSWNISNALLKRGQFEKGWNLFDYGLRAPSSSKQRWQRALFKPYTESVLPLWRGQSLTDKRLLILEEQAVGDIMMFMTLIPKLLEESKVVSILINDRLLSLYLRSFSEQIKANELRIISRAQVAKGEVTPSDFDYQCPIGSICQHRFLDLTDYGNYLPLLVPKPTRVNQLRSRYISWDNNSNVDKLIGISWRGGAGSTRMNQKSIAPTRFFDLLRDLPGYRFISLQYGDSESIVNKFQESGIDVIHDSEVNPLKQMDLWVAQVAACDAVLSVANTTIHGSGGLDIPTMCLLSIHSDWRWFDDEDTKFSYWYPSVAIARERKIDGWNEAFSTTRRWLENGCPRLH